jgi:transcriptional regulator with XRE-family HTH domain
MSRLDRGAGLKQAIHIARERAELTSDVQVADKSGVSYDTLMNWFGNKTTPRPHQIRKVADALGVRFSDLMDAWEGRETEPPALHAVIRELIAEMRLDRAQQHEATVAILRALSTLVPGGPARTGTHVGNGGAPGGDTQRRP